MLDYDINEDNLLSFYNLASLNPTSKAQLQVSDTFAIESVKDLTKQEQFDVLNKLINKKLNHTTRKVEVTERDAEDPLVGPGSNIVPLLLNNGLITSTNDEEINNYLISSQAFNLQQYLTKIHSDSSIEQLTSYLAYIEKSIKLQQHDVQGVIDSNFVNFINCKKSIDEVLVKFKQEKNRAQKDKENSKIFLPSHSNINAKDDSLSSTLEDSIKNLHTTLALMIRPIQENSNKETKLLILIEFIKSNQFFFDLPTKIIKNISENNHDAVVDDYNRFLHEKKNFQDIKIRKLDEQIQQSTDEKEIVALQDERLIILTATSKLFSNVEKIVAEYRKRIYKQLLGLDYEASTRNRNKSNAKFIDLVDKIYQLDANKIENPIANFLITQVSALQDELEYQLTKFDDKFRMMQRKLIDHIGSLADTRVNGSHVRYIAEKYSQIESYFQASTTAMSEQEQEKVSLKIFGNSDNLDLSIINETWLVLINFISYLEDNFTKHLKKFVTNYNHYGTEFDIDPHGQIQQKFEKLVNRTVDILILLFEDESKPATQVESIPSNFKQFVPHYSNSLSGIFYLSVMNNKLNQFLNGLGAFVGSVGNFNKSTETNKIIKALRSCSTKLNQRIIEAICCLWVNDCSQLYDLESWKISEIETGNDPELNDGAAFTKLMNIIEHFHGFALTKLYELMYQKESASQEIRINSSHPSKRTLVSVEIQFIRALNITLDSIMKKYNLDRKEFPGRETDVFKILTMNNFDILSKAIYPILIRKFDKLFAKDLEKQNLQIFANIENAIRTIFDDIINKQKLKISQKVIDFFDSSKNAHHLKVDGFIYDILMQFVKLIHNVKPITGDEVFVNIVNELQQGVLKSMLDNLRNHSNLGIIDTTNIKLDVNFFMEVFESSKTLKINEASFRVIEVLLNTLEERIVELGSDETSKAEFEEILNENLSVSANQFDCF